MLNKQALTQKIYQDASGDFNKFKSLSRNLINGGKLKLKDGLSDKEIYNYFKKGKVIFSNKIHDDISKGKTQTRMSLKELSQHYSPGFMERLKADWNRSFAFHNSYKTPKIKKEEVNENVPLFGKQDDSDKNPKEAPKVDWSKMGPGSDYKIPERPVKNTKNKNKKKKKKKSASKFIKEKENNINNVNSANNYNNTEDIHSSIENAQENTNSDKMFTGTVLGLGGAGAYYSYKKSKKQNNS